MTELRRFELNDFEDVVSMYRSFTFELYPNRKIGAKYFFYKKVMEWIDKDAHIIIAMSDGKTVGFSLCYIDDFSGLTEPVYQCDLAYVIPEKRRSRAAHMLFNNGYEFAREHGLKVNTSCRAENGTDKMVQKHFGLSKTMTTLEG